MAVAATFFHKAVTLAGVIVFLAFLCLPVADHFFDLAPTVNLMEPTPDPLPPFSLREAFKFFNVLQRGYLEKTFGFRKLLVREQNFLDVCGLGSASLYQNVIKGKGDWLFLAQENTTLNVVEDYRGSRLFTPEQLARWVDIYRDRRDWLAAQGIPYLIVVAPNKHTVYPERLPEQYNRVNPKNRTDQLLTALQDAGIEVLDLRSAMARVKADAPVYYRTDTHWTTFGAFAAYVEIMQRLSKWFPDFAKEIRTDFAITLTPGFEGGLASMLALSDKFSENRVTFTPKTPRRAVAGENPGTPKVLFQPTEVMAVGDPNLPTAVVIRDSFAHELVPFLAEHFRQSVYLWPYPSSPRAVRDFDRDVIAALQPNVVIDEFVERYFTEFPAAAK